VFESSVLVVSFVAAAAASIVGFGIGSLLTPLLALQFEMPLAVAIVSVPHAAATALRCWRLRRAIDRTVLVRFGLLSAAGALAGALLFTRIGGAALTRTLGALLVLTAAAGLSGFAARWRPHGAMVWLLGGLSGLFGGVAGNQGGLRAAALSSFGLVPAAFVATSTATGLLVDAARMPLYVWHRGGDVLDAMPIVAMATAGVVAGTLAGEIVLRRIPPETFRRVVSATVGALGLWLLR
jgi:hypothetical protein